MTSRLTIAALIAAAALTFSSSAFASSGECRAAADKYETQRANVFNAMQGYGHCVSVNDGRDECSEQFSTLESAQNRFESAVSNYSSDCEDD